jgi:hypothetical protein
VAFVGVSGTLPRDKDSFVWSEDPPRDAAHIRLILSDLKDKLTPATGRLITMGTPASVRTRSRLTSSRFFPPG